MRVNAPPAEPRAAHRHSDLFNAAFKQSKNPMALVDSNRCLVDANGAYLRLLGHPMPALIGQPVYAYIVGGPRASQAEWEAAIGQGRFTGETVLRAADGREVSLQYAATSEVVTGRYLVLFVGLSTSRWGNRFRRPTEVRDERLPISQRECDVLTLVAMGETGPEIADELGISHNTVRTHIRNTMDKLDARSRAHLVAIALGDGIILSDALRARLGSGIAVP
jgi:PAS domain S-box-containing protein